MTKLDDLTNAVNKAVAVMQEAVAELNAAIAADDTATLADLTEKLQGAATALSAIEKPPGSETSDPDAGTPTPAGA